jgi:hypothetical protein
MTEFSKILYTSVARTKAEESVNNLPYQLFYSTVHTVLEAAQNCYLIPFSEAWDTEFPLFFRGRNSLSFFAKQFYWFADFFPNWDFPAKYSFMKYYLMWLQWSYGKILASFVGGGWSWNPKRAILFLVLG